MLQDKEGAEFFFFLAHGDSHLIVSIAANGCEVTAQLLGQPQWGDKVRVREVFSHFNHLKSLAWMTIGMTYDI